MPKLHGIRTNKEYNEDSHEIDEQDELMLSPTNTCVGCEHSKESYCNKHNKWAYMLKNKDGQIRCKTSI